MVPASLAAHVRIQKKAASCAGRSPTTHKQVASGRRTRSGPASRPAGIAVGAADTVCMQSDGKYRSQMSSGILVCCTYMFWKIRIGHVCNENISPQLQAPHPPAENPMVETNYCKKHRSLMAFLAQPPPFPQKEHATDMRRVRCLHWSSVTKK